MFLRDDTDGAMSATQGREILPSNVKPTHYALTLEPDLVKHTYTGTVVIDLDVNEASSSISFNTVDIDIKKATVHGANGVLSDSPRISRDEDKQTHTVSFDGSLAAGSKARLALDFTGTLNDNMAGFYRSTYKDKTGSTKYMATTQMEPTDARRAFPCFDEPALKAGFTVTLIADPGLTCLGNMDVASQKEITSSVTQTQKQAVTFNTTPPMSTYLLAFIVGELNVIESKDFRIPVRVFAPPDQDINHGKFSVDLAAKTLAFYEKKFDSQFPLPKMDMVAIPDFSAGAMENWGLVTYRVVDVLFDEKTSGAMTKQRVAEVVQHELAHQWFGNLVTMDFWEGLWLNEGFATWMSWFSCNEFYPEWKVWQSYVTDNLAGALSLDSLRSSHPVEVPVKRADEVNQIFDAISYSKGSCVLRMVSKFLGEETFLEGIRRYLKKHAYGNTQTTDLWNALSDASGKNVADVMHVWTREVGYPVLSVTEQGDNINIKQNRFLRTNDVKPEEDQTLYPVFLALRTKQGVDEEQTLFEREKTLKKPADDFYKLNADHSGTYRTFYPASRLEKLGQAAKSGLLSVEDRAGMIADAGALSASGYQPSSGTLSLLDGFKSETEYVVWDQVSSWISSLRSAWVFEDEESKNAIKAFFRDLVSDKAHQLGWSFQQGEDNIQQQFKALMFSSAGSAGDEKVIKAAQDMFERFSKGEKEAINPNIRGSVFSIVLENGGEKEYEVVLNVYKNGDTADERNTALRALGRAKEPKLIQRTLDLAMGNEVRSQDIYMPLGGLRTHKEGIVALWESMQTNWDMLVKRLPPGLSMLGSVVTLCTSSFTHPDQMADVERFFKDRSTKGFDQTLAQSLDSIRSKTNWVQRDSKDVSEWLKSHGYFR
ncbi:MAG: hypothetical protein Q9159_005768 [Coniocarpon cinnabarinum]